MTYFVKDPTEQKANAEENLRLAIEELGRAADAYVADDSREVEMAWRAARRYVKEAKAQLEEWTQ